MSRNSAVIESEFIPHNPGRDCYGKLACAVLATAFMDLSSPIPEDRDSAHYFLVGTDENTKIVRAHWFKQSDLKEPEPAEMARLMALAYENGLAKRAKDKLTRGRKPKKSNKVDSTLRTS